ncbi:nicotinamide N-methyltransferase-like isoform X2 [Hemicordylus capensis]|uniref:nicotinamide N-methyltransferase-like isoform X2 n=1 Tax=Hemicordylus capensis TaxID=884348 RepID=UPI002302119E|nr:nicotinamide N-methyltransferase-like isoform X2 [Hemicordylus capensis]
MAAFTGGDVYQAEFDPKAYLEYFRFGEGTLGDEDLEFALRGFCETFASGQLKGDTLIDIGSGPTIHQLLSACESFENIIASDYADQNCQEMERWLKNEPGAFDWTPVVKDQWLEKEAKLRRAVKQVLKCDVHRSNPLDPVTLPRVDCLVSKECLEAACKDHHSYRAALNNLSALLKLGGHLVLSGVLGCSFYMVGPHQFSSLVLTEEFLREALSTSGFAIVKFQTEPRRAQTMFEVCDFSGKYFLVARKEKEP